MVPQFYVHGFDPNANGGCMRLISGLAIAGFLLLQGCVGVEANEKEQLGRRLMQLDANELETSYQNKVLFSREASGGKPGHSAGGGCGCGN
jgi:hypothetical protein